MKALVAGLPEPAAALAAALAERGLDARAYEASGTPGVAGLVAAFTDLERALEGVGVAVAVDAGDAPTALAVTATKLGVPLVTWAPGVAGDHGSPDQAELRIIATLADRDAGSGSAAEAAALIASWPDLNLDR